MIGALALGAVLERSRPLGVLVVMLGTNDLQAGVERVPEAIAADVVAIAQTAQAANRLLFSTHAAPVVLLVSSPPLGETAGICRVTSATYWIARADLRHPARRGNRFAPQGARRRRERAGSGR